MKAKKWVSYGIFCLLIPAVVAGGALLFEEKQYAWVSLCAAVLACVPFFLHFERKTGRRAVAAPRRRLLFKAGSEARLPGAFYP